MIHFRVGAKRHIDLVVSSNTYGYNVFTAAGSPADAVDITLTINSGIYFNGFSGALPAGSAILLVNKGILFGASGMGGGSDSPGTDGGDAFSTSVPLTVDNTAGYIWEGCGGGGGGGHGTDPGGGNVSNGGHGAYGAGFGPAGLFLVGTNGRTNGSVGAAGSVGGDGGNGGLISGSTYIPSVAGTSGSYLGGGGVAGGNPGYAIRLNGNLISWSGGNNSTQCVGLVG
jgi:hypothetical protein